MTEDNQVVHIDDSHLPIDDAETAGHEPEFDPYTYDGGDVDTIAEASGWGGTAWEAYTDARDDRNLAAVTAEAFAKGQASVVGGIDMSGDTSDIHVSALNAMWRAETLYQIAGVKDLAETILAEYPDATHLELEDSDQEGSAFIGTRVLDANGNELGDMEEFEDHWAALSDLPDRPQHWVEVGEDGTTTSTGDARYSFIELEGS